MNTLRPQPTNSEAFAFAGRLGKKYLNLRKRFLSIFHPS